VLQANSLPEPFPAGEFEIGSVTIPGGSVAVLRPAAAALSQRDQAVLVALKASGKPTVVAELTRSIDHQSFPAEGDGRRKAIDRSLQALVDAGLAAVEGQGRNRTARTVEASR
jgi:hypothetical protein